MWRRVGVSFRVEGAACARILFRPSGTLNRPRFVSAFASAFASAFVSAFVSDLSLICLCLCLCLSSLRAFVWAFVCASVSFSFRWRWDRQTAGGGFVALGLVGAMIGTNKGGESWLGFCFPSKWSEFHPRATFCRRSFGRRSKFGAAFRCSLVG